MIRRLSRPEPFAPGRALPAGPDRSPQPRSSAGRQSAPGPLPRSGARAPECRGAVTAEFAVTLPAVVLLLALVLAGSAAGLTQLRLEEAARAGARALARGDDAAAVGVTVRQLAGESARAAIASDGAWRSVTVSAAVTGALGPLVPWTLTARAWARTETADAVALPGAPASRPAPGRSA
ncbi:hypothetical protein ASG71_04960 [Arthrobacter sp. Soil763]|nr:hypothetical protein ASG71_04960 [Arthrobacter sp. Soil763]